MGNDLARRAPADPPAAIPAGVAAKVDNALTYLTSIFGAALVDQVREALTARIADYMREYGLTVGDVSAAFRRMADPAVAAKIRNRYDLMAEFSASADIAMRYRRDREDAERRRQEAEADRRYRESDAGKAELAQIRPRFEAWLKDFTTTFGAMPGRKPGQHRGGDRGGRQGKEGRDRGQGGREAGGQEVGGEGDGI